MTEALMFTTVALIVAFFGLPIVDFLEARRLKHDRALDRLKKRP